MPARLSRRAATEPVEERPGSGQSPASRAKDLAAQPALLAGIAKKAPIHGGKRVRGLTYSFARAAAATSKPPSRRSGARTSKARLEFVRAKYQKGDSVGTYTGAVYARGVPSYGFNQTYKDKVNAKLLTEELRFNTELKMYVGRRRACSNVQLHGSLAGRLRHPLLRRVRPHFLSSCGSLPRSLRSQRHATSHPDRRTEGGGGPPQ